MENWFDDTVLKSEVKRDYLGKVPNWVQYVPCPECLERKHFVDIMLCDEKDFKICTVRMCMHCGLDK
jgi:hypothetical protein